MNLRNIMLYEKSWTQRAHSVRFNLHEVTRIVKFTETENRIEVAMWLGQVQKGYRIFIWRDEKVIQMDGDDGCKTP